VSREQIKAKIMAAAYLAAAELGAAEAIRLLDEAVTQIRNDQWSGPGSR
jgi:hypothetical protein